MKTSELTGVQLDWAVAKCEGIEYVKNDIRFSGAYSRKYSTDWARGGAIIEREKLWLEPINGGEQWWSVTLSGNHEGEGTTPLIAAMRCYVASKLGDEVELPEGL